MRDLEPAEDPFVDIESQLIGETDVWLNALANMVEFAADTSILSVFGQVQGKMHVEINPCDRNGNTGMVLHRDIPVSSLEVSQCASSFSHLFCCPALYSGLHAKPYFAPMPSDPV